MWFFLSEEPSVTSFIETEGGRKEKHEKLSFIDLHFGKKKAVVGMGGADGCITT